MMVYRLALPIVCSVFIACAVGVESADTQDADAGGDHDTFQKKDAAIVVDMDASTPQMTGDDAGNATVDAGVDAPIVIIDSGSLCSGGSGTLVTYDFSGAPGDQASTAASSTMSGLTAASIARASTITAVSGSGSINGSGWSTSAIDATRYYTFELTPPTSCALDITSIAIDTKESSTGPSSASIATSDDSYATKTTFTVNASTTASMSVSGATKAVEVRVYGYDASGTAGTMRIQNTLTVTGSLK